jgi:hypothetical protein
MNKSYTQIRETCQLLDYSYKLAGKYGVWVEHYRDQEREYFALFGDTATDMPTTITYLNLQ